MKKLYLLSLSTYATRNSEYIKAVKIFFLAFIFTCVSYSGFAQVIVTPANNTLICSKTAVGGTAPSCTALGVIAITESLTTDFSIGVDQVTLVPPAGWQFCTVPAPTLGHTGTDISAGPITTSFTSTSISISFTVTATSSTDQVTITGLHVQPLSTTAPAGSITASSVTGINGIVVAPVGVTDFGDLAIIPAPISGVATICNGSTAQFSDATTGGVWSSSNTVVATVGSTGVVTAKGVGTTNIIYTVFGCSDIFGVTVLASPPNIVGIKDACEYSTGYYIHDVDSTGGSWGFISTGVTVKTLPTQGTGFVSINYPGTDTITYINTATGCSVSDTLTVWPVPNPIVGTDTICQGSITNLSDNIAGGFWSSGNTSVATVGSSTGTVTGVGPGTATIFYTLPTGCNIDTVVTVNPLPSIITGTPNACLGLSTTLSDSIGGGAWTISNGNVTLTPTGPNSALVTGVLFGTDTITYTLATGCLTTIAVTVNPVPGPITATTTQECVNDSSIVLSDTSAGGSWMSGNLAIGTVDPFTGSVYGVSGGVDTISYAFATGCASTITVTINPLPAPITGPDSACSFSSAFSLFDITPSGVILPASAWSSSNPTIAFIDVTGAVTPKLPGVDTITYTLVTGCSVTYTITIDPLPAPITGISVICVGSTTSLSDSSPGGFWSSSNPAVGSIDSVSGVVTGILTGSTTITYTLATGGCDVTYGVTVTPFPTAISIPDSVCMGIAVTVTGTPGGGTWASSNPAVGTIDMITGNFTGISPGLDTIYYSLGGSSCTISQTVTVNSFGPISPSAAAVCVGDSVQLADSLAPGGTWSSSNTTIVTIDTSGYITGVASGTAIITYVSSFGCTATEVVTVNPLSPITGPDSVCAGGATINLSDAVTGGIWTTTDTTRATVTPTGPGSALVTGVNSGTVIIVYTLPTGCAAAITLLVDPLPNPITAPDSICQGDMVTLTDFPLTGSWSSGNLTIGTIDPTTGLFTGLSGGLDTVTYTLNTGACSVTDTIRVNPITQILGIDSLCVGASTNLSDATSGGSWSSTNTNVATIDPVTGHVDGILAGTSIISYIMPTGCSAIVTVTVDPIPGVITGPDSVCAGATTTLSDTPPGGAWSSGSPGVGTIDPITGVVTGITAGTTIITYTLSTGGCTATTVVTVNPVPTAILPSPADVCLGFTVNLSDATPGGVWSSTNTAIAIVGTAGLVTSVTPGTDTVIYTLPITGCPAADMVTVHAPPIDTIVTPPIMCRGASEPLLATGATVGTTPGTYVWSPAYGLSATLTSVGPTIASPTVTTTYTVVGTNKYGCSDTSTVIVLVDSLLNHLKITGKDSICAGDSTELIATGNIVSHFSWYPFNGLSCTICDTVFAYPDTTTAYEATAIDPYGCKDSVGITIYVLPHPLLNVYAEPHVFPITLCRGTPLQLLAFGAWSYVWSPNLFLSCDSCANPVATDTFNMVYQLTGYSEFGCPTTIPVKVSVLDTNYNIIFGDTSICYGKVTQIGAFSHSVTGNLDEPTYLWTPAAGLNDPTISNPLAGPGSSTVYTVVITENSCFSDTGTVTVNVEPYPQIVITPPSEDVPAGTAIAVTATVTNTPIQSYVWTPADGTVGCDTCFNPIITPTVSGTQYTVTATSIYGCASQDTVTYFIACNSDQVFIPNMFSPNGDGKNDYFYISAKGLQTITTFDVFNRWGQLVFEAHNISPNNPNAGWDGTFKGIVCEPDVFFYVVDAICELGEPFKYKRECFVSTIGVLKTIKRNKQ